MSEDAHEPAGPGTPDPQPEPPHAPVPKDLQRVCKLCGKAVSFDGTNWWHTGDPLRPDSSNAFAVGMTVGGKVLVHGILNGQPLMFSRGEALNLAAWLSVLADPGGKEFGRLVHAIKA